MHILLIEDDATIAHELSLHWAGRGWPVRHCSHLREASDALKEAAADLIVLDQQLPDGDGLRWLEDWRRVDGRTPVIILTARDQVSDRVAGLRAGADDYLVKPFARDELDARIEALRRRSETAQGAGVQFGPVVVLEAQGCAFLHGQPLPLHPREFEVLGLLVRRSPKLVSKRVLLDALAERNLELGDSAIEVYISRIRRKLQGSGVSIQTARGFGYRLTVDGEQAADAAPSP